MQFHSRVSLIACFFVAAFTPVLFAFGGADRLRAEYPTAFEKLRSSVNKVRCKASARIGLDNTMECSIFINNDSELVKNQHQLSMGKVAEFATLQCRTPDHYFRLFRDAEDRPFTIKVLSKTPDLTEGVSLIGNIDSVTHSAFVLDDVPLRKIVEHPSFRITKDENRQGGLITISFVCDDPTHWISGGTIVFDPTLEWAIAEHDVTIARRAGMTMPTGSHYKGTVKCRRSPSGNVYPEEVKHQFIYPDGLQEPARSYQFEFADIPASQFRLSAYGLPDSLFEPRRSATLPVSTLLAALGILFLLITLILRRRASRQVT